MRTLLLLFVSFICCMSLAPYTIASDSSTIYEFMEEVANLIRAYIYYKKTNEESAKVEKEESAKIKKIEKESEQIKRMTELQDALLKADSYNNRAIAVVNSSCHNVQYEIDDPQVQDALTKAGLLPEHARQIPRDLCTTYREYQAYLKQKRSAEKQ